MFEGITFNTKKSWFDLNFDIIFGLHWLIDSKHKNQVSLFVTNVILILDLSFEIKKSRKKNYK